MSKPLFRPIAPLEVDDSALDALNDRLGVPTMVPAPKSPAANHAPVPRTLILTTSFPTRGIPTITCLF